MNASFHITVQYILENGSWVAFLYDDSDPMPVLVSQPFSSPRSSILNLWSQIETSSTNDFLETIAGLDKPEEPC